MDMKYRTHIRPSQISIDYGRSHVTVVGCPQLMEAYGFYIGEGMAMFRGRHKEIYILDTETGVMRQFVDIEERLLVDDSEVNDRQIASHLSHGYNYLHDRIAGFGGLHAWDGFKGGFCALDWTIYPDGRYFADDGGFGMEDNDAEVAYCVIDRNLEIVVPFFYADSPREVIDAVRAGTYECAPVEPIDRREVIVDEFPQPTRWEKLTAAIRRISYSVRKRLSR